MNKKGNLMSIIVIMWCICALIMIPFCFKANIDERNAVKDFCEDRGMERYSTGTISGVYCWDKETHKMHKIITEDSGFPFYKLEEIHIAKEVVTLE